MSTGEEGLNEGGGLTLTGNGPEGDDNMNQWKQNYPEEMAAHFPDPLVHKGVGTEVK